MKIKKIKIENFKSIGKLEYTPKSTITMLIGPNGKGKTAFKEAFYAGITGEFPNNCIQNGKETCSVEITLDDGFVFERQINRTKANKIIINGKTSTAKTLNEQIAHKFALSKDVLKVVASTDVLQNMNPSDFGRFILQYLPELMDFATIVPYLDPNQTDAQKLLEEALPAMPDTFDIRTLAQTHAEFMEKRKVAKRVHLALDAKIKSFKGTIPARPMEIVEDQLNEMLRREGAQNQAKQTILIYNAAVKNKKLIEENLLKLRQKIESNTASKPNQDDWDNLKAEKENINKEMVSAQTTINTIKENIRIFTNTIRNLNKPVCPISEKLVCTTDKTGIKEELENLIQSNNETIQVQEEFILRKKEELKEIEKKETTYKENEIAYREKVLMINQYKKQKESIPVLPQKPDNLKIYDFSPVIEKLRKERDNCIAYGNYLKDKKELDKVAVEINALDYLCEELKPKGRVMTLIISKYLGIFESMCNETAGHLREGFEFKFIANDGITYLIKPAKNKEFGSFSSLSSGEQLLSLFILTDMLNKLTGSRLMILDDLDKLDIGAFKELTEIISNPEVQKEYDHILICAVNHDDILAITKSCDADMVY